MLPQSTPPIQAVLENADLRVILLPGYGARVTHLLDKRTGRDWMAPGGVSANTGEDAVYREGEAVGWDECFPTVGRCDAGDTAWGRKLRDHGDVWGRPWSILQQTATVLDAEFAGSNFRFGRTLTLDGETLVADYRAVNTGTQPLPYLWALHGLLATRPGEQIELPGVKEVVPRFLSLDGRRLPFEQLSWPGVSTALPFPLDRVQDASIRFSAKLYAPDIHAASVGGEGGTLALSWEGIDHLGIWITYGNWPEPGSPIHHLALEPTSAPIDDLRQGLEQGNGTTLAPGEEKSWRVMLTLRPGR